MSVLLYHNFHLKRPPRSRRLSRISSTPQRMTHSHSISSRSWTPLKFRFCLTSWIRAVYRMSACFKEMPWKTWLRSRPGLSSFCQTRCSHGVFSQTHLMILAACGGRMPMFWQQAQPHWPPCGSIFESFLKFRIGAENGFFCDFTIRTTCSLFSRRWRLIRGANSWDQSPAS